jgi:hypothetical protein
MKTSIVTAALLAGLAGTAAADDAAGPAPESKQLDALVGAWKGTGTLAMGDQKIDLTISITCVKAAAGFAVTCKDKFAGGGLVMEESDLFGWEPNTKTVHWYAVTNGGEVHDHAGHFDDKGTVLTVEHNGTMDGKPFKEDITITWSGKNAWSFVTTQYVDGKPAGAFEGKAKKKGKK